MAVKICDIESLDLCQFIFWVKSYPDGITASCFSLQATSVSAYLLAQYHVSDNVCHCWSASNRLTWSRGSRPLEVYPSLRTNVTNVAVGTFATSSTLHSLHRSDPRMCPSSVARDLGLLPKCRRSKVRSQIPDRPTGPLSHRSLGVWLAGGLCDFRSGSHFAGRNSGIPRGADRTGAQHRWRSAEFALDRTEENKVILLVATTTGHCPCPQLHFHESSVLRAASAGGFS